MTTKKYGYSKRKQMNQCDFTCISVLYHSRDIVQSLNNRCKYLENNQTDSSSNLLPWITYSHIILCHSYRKFLNTPYPNQQNTLITLQ